LPLDDVATYEIFQRGETLAIFQLEGSMATRMTIDVRPTNFDDVVALMPGQQRGLIFPTTTPAVTAERINITRRSSGVRSNVMS
jgi:hypothetical protein